MKGKKKTLVGKEGLKKTFEVKRIQVWQMCETEEQKRIREEKLQHLIEREQEILKTVNNETITQNSLVNSKHYSS